MDKNRRKLLGKMFLLCLTAINSNAVAAPFTSLILRSKNDLPLIRDVGSFNVEIEGWILKKSDLSYRE